MFATQGTARIILDYVVPSIGIVVSFLLFLAPFPRVLAVRRRLTAVANSVRVSAERARCDAPLPTQPAATPMFSETILEYNVHSNVATGRHSGADSSDLASVPSTGDSTELAPVELVLQVTPNELNGRIAGIPMNEVPTPLSSKFGPTMDEPSVDENILGPVNPLPYPLMLGNAIGWISYAFVQSDYFVFWANAPGMMLCIFYVVVAYAALRLDEWRKRQITSGERQRPEGVRALPLAPASSGHWWTHIRIASGLLNRRNATGAVSGTQSESNTGLPPRIEDPLRPTDLPIGNGALTSSLVRSDTTESLVPKPLPAELQRHPWVAGLSMRRMFEGLLFIIALVLTVSAFFVFIPLASNGVWRNQSARVLISGLVANIILGFMYSSPLFLIRTVFRTRDASMIDRNLAIMSLVNGTLWTAYGFAKQEPFIYVLNIFGASLGAIQLALIGIFGGRRSHRNPAVVQSGVEPAFTTAPAQLVNVARNEPDTTMPSTTLVLAERPLHLPVATVVVS
jgi:hypothetical protein